MSVVKSNETEINLILLDEDPIFVLGLKELCRNPEFSDINIIATGKIKELYSLLGQQTPDLWVIVLDLARFSNQAKEFISYLPQLAKNYPEINLLLMLNPQELLYDFSPLPIVKGCCYKYLKIEKLIDVFRLCASGEKYFPPIKKSSSRRYKFNSWFYQQCKFGLQEINQQIQDLNQYTQNKKLSVLDLIYWQGRKRELKLTKWLIRQTIPNSILNTSLLESSQVDDSEQTALPESELNRFLESQLILAQKSFNNYDFTIAKIENTVKNRTKKIYEIDILKTAKKKELFLKILTEWQEIISDLKRYNFTELELLAKIEGKTFLLNLIEENIINLTGGIKYSFDDNQNAIIQSETLETITNKIFEQTFDQVLKIPFVTDLVCYQVLEKSLIIDSQIYQYNSDDAQEIEAIIFENTVIAIANCVMQFILNEFYDNLAIKDKLFDPRLKSSRKVAMFRNNLAWRYRQETYWQNPKNIFEDKYEMLRFTYQGIENCQISHSRHLELNQIQGIPWLVTILIELRDSLSRGIKALGDTFGQVIVYLLTEVIGKGLGLIGKGILQGIGSKIKN